MSLFSLGNGMWAWYLYNSLMNSSAKATSGWRSSAISSVSFPAMFNQDAKERIRTACEYLLFLKPERDADLSSLRVTPYEMTWINDDACPPRHITGPRASDGRPVDPNSGNQIGSCLKQAYVNTRVLQVMRNHLRPTSASRSRLTLSCRFWSRLRWTCKLYSWPSYLTVHMKVKSFWSGVNRGAWTRP